MTSIPAVIWQACHLSHAYAPQSLQQPAVPVFHDICLSIHAGEKIALVGPSGVGKSTFLHMAGLLDVPQEGDILVHPATQGHDDTYDGMLKAQGMMTRALPDVYRTRLRNRMFGFIYQFHHLLGEFTALENVMMPALLSGQPLRNARQRASVLLDAVGLGDRMHHHPSALSGGQQQRTAIARALVNRPALLIADEPTGNLDEETAHQVFELLLQMTRHEGMAILMATHNPRLHPYFDQVLTFRQGMLTPLVDNSLPHHPE